MPLSTEHIVSGSDDRTIRIWDAGTGAVVGEPLKVHTNFVLTAAYSPNGWYIISGSSDRTIRIWEVQTGTEISKPHQGHTECAKPDLEGWVRDVEGGLLYWVPPECRAGLHLPALLTLPLTSHIRTVSLDFEDFVYGTSWAQIFSSARP